jgi:putative transposase
LTAHENGVIERWFRSLTEECVWVNSFADFTEPRRAIAAWIAWCNAERPHQSLGYRSPAEFRGQSVRPAA